MRREGAVILHPISIGGLAMVAALATAACGGESAPAQNNPLATAEPSGGKQRLAMRPTAIAAGGVAAASQNPSSGATGACSPQEEAKVSGFIREWDEGSGLGASSKGSVQCVELNGQGPREALIVLDEPSSNCGARGCVVFVVDLSGSKARSLGDFIGTSLEPLRTSAAGWRDLSLNGTRMTFQNGVYKPRGSSPSAAAETVPAYPLAGPWVSAKYYPLACESGAPVVYLADGTFSDESVRGTWDLERDRLTLIVTEAHHEDATPGQRFQSRIEWLDRNQRIETLSDGRRITLRRCP